MLAILLLILVALAAFPVSWLKGMAERKLADQFDRPVSIGAMEREAAFSFNPVIRIADVRIAQAPWAGTGDLLHIRALRLRAPVLPLLVGRFSPHILSASGLRLDLVRDAQGRKNWEKPDKTSDDGGGGGQPLAIASMEDAVIRYRDAVQKRDFTLNVAVDPVKGLTAKGTGAVDGAPVTLALTGGAMQPGKPWPFTAAIDGDRLAMQVKGTMAGPLRSDDMTFRITARADDLKRLDRVIEAGLFGTQPVELAADVRHKDKGWTVEKLRGAIGQSPLQGNITVRKQDGRTKLDGTAHFTRLDFDDLASDQGNAQAIALEKAQGLRLVPNTVIDISKIDKTDGRIAVRADRLVSRRRPSSLTDISAVLTMDRQLLTAEIERLGVGRGAITGRVTVNQRDGRPVPLVALDLRLSESRLSDLMGKSGQQEVDGPVQARVKLTGTGRTIRDAVGRSDGNIGFFIGAGALPSPLASLIGFDIGRGLLKKGEGQVRLRCAAMGLSLKQGAGAFGPFVIDTGISQMSGTGTLRFPTEAISATLAGAPKGDALLRLPGTVNVGGTIRAPDIQIPRETKSAGNVLKAIGRAIRGKDGPQAADADCTALSRRVLG